MGSKEENAVKQLASDLWYEVYNNRQFVMLGSTYTIKARLFKIGRTVTKGERTEWMIMAKKEWFHIFQKNRKRNSLKIIMVKSALFQVVHVNT